MTARRSEAHVRSVLLANHRDDEAVTWSPEGKGRLASELLCRADAFASYLHAQEASQEVLVAVSCRFDFACALIGVWLSGRVAALAPNSQPEFLAAWAARQSERRSDGDTDGWIVADEATAIVRRYASCLEMAPRATALIRQDLARICGEGATELLSVWTSGSTGTHQCYPKTVSQILDEAALHASYFPWRARQAVVATIPAHHIYGLLCTILVPLFAGARMPEQTVLMPQAIEHWVKAASGGIFVTVPAHLQALSSLPDAAFAKLAMVFSSGAPLNPAVARNVSERLAGRIVELFGSTETGGIASRTPTGNDEAWTPLPGVVVDCGAQGELTLQSSFLAADWPQPWSAPDQIEMAEAGSFRYLGRSDGVVKIAGKRIALAQVERSLLAISGVQDACVIAMPGARLRGIELAAVVVAPGHRPASLRAQLSSCLDPVVLPRRYRFVDAIVRNAQGKVDLTELKQLHGME